MPFNGKHAVMEWSEESCLTIEGKLVSLASVRDCKVLHQKRKFVKMLASKWGRVLKSRNGHDQELVIKLHEFCWLITWLDSLCVLGVTGWHIDTVYTNNWHLELEDTSITMWLELMVFRVEFGKLSHLSSIVDLAQILDQQSQVSYFLDKKII